MASLHTSCELEKKKLISENEARISSLHQEYAKKIQGIREEIESRKEILAKMDEKEMLANVLIALDSYGGRFERIEKQLSAEQIIEDFNKEVKTVTDQFSDLTVKLARQINVASCTISQSLSNSDQVKKIESISSDIDSIRSDIDSIRSEIDSISSDTGSISSDVETIINRVSSTYGYNTIDTIANSVEEIKSDIWSLKSTIEDAKNAAEYAQSAAQYAQSAAENAQAAAENIRNGT